MSKDILADITARDAGLFPAPKEIELDCSCPDWADMCKHVAAVLYGVGARLDEKPELFFTLRGVDLQELVTAASERVVVPAATESAADTALAGADLAEIFGVAIEASPVPATTAVAKLPRASKAPRKPPRPTRKPSRRPGAAKPRPAKRLPSGAKPVATLNRRSSAPKAARPA